MESFQLHCESKIGCKVAVMFRPQFSVREKCCEIKVVTNTRVR